MVAGVPYSYALSLRPSPAGGGNEEMEANARELWAGIKAIALELLKEHLQDNQVKGTCNMVCNSLTTRYILVRAGYWRCRNVV